MSTLEKFGILVILILVVIIGVVAVWGVGGGEEGLNPFGDGGSLARVDDAGNPDAIPDPRPWPDHGPVSAVPDPAPVPVPPVDARPLPPVPVDPASLTPASPPASAGGTYKVRSGDTYSRIAEEVYGDRSKWTVLRDANPDVDPRRLKIGQVLAVPAAGTAVARTPAPRVPAPRPRAGNAMFDGGLNPDDGPSMETVAPAGATEYVIRKGDTLSKIAVDFLGSAAKYHRLIEANPGLEPRSLRPGQRITIPAAE